MIPRSRAASVLPSANGRRLAYACTYALRLKAAIPAAIEGVTGAERFCAGATASPGAGQNRAAGAGAVCAWTAEPVDTHNAAKIVTRAVQRRAFIISSPCSRPLMSGVDPIFNGT